ncbi:MAG: hypothetical protein JNM01_12765 [Delftia acidovorans]|nr:hypothetical protein [Delftia acidovorans]
MRMAKPAARDIDAADELHWILSAIDSRSGPWETDGPESLRALLEPGDDTENWIDFDCDERMHLQALYNSLAKLLRRAPNFYGRVIGGMCHVICWDRNQILDPADDCLALHPDLRAGLRLLQDQRADFLPRLEREARAAVASTIEAAAARHVAEMRLSADVAAIQRALPQQWFGGWDLVSGPDRTVWWRP